MKNLLVCFFVMSLLLTTPLVSALELPTESIATMNVPHQNGGVVADGGNLYVWTGYSSGGRTSVLESYDPATNLWINKSSVSGARNGIGEFVLNGSIYSVGGEKSPSGSFTNTVYRYNIAGNSWQTLNPFPTNIWDPLSVVCGDTAYMIGGRHGYGVTYDHVYAYNATNDSWVSKANMPYSVYQASTVCYDNKIWVFGGDHKTSESSNLYTNKVQIYDPALNTWSYGNDMPVTFNISQAVTYGQSAWIFNHQSTSVYEFNFTTGLWSTHQYNPPQSFNCNNNLALIGNLVYFTDTTTGDAFCVAIPEPATVSLLLLGGMAAVRRRKA